jgi:predicted ABC-type ATPase
MKPWLILLAGPNGSGKSTLARQPDFRAKAAEAEAVFLNPDDIAKSAPAGSNPMIWSGREMHRLVDYHTSSRRSFIVETTLSGSNHFRTVENCKKAGYETALHFVFVSSLKLANARVALRVKLGGHNVPESDQARRYEKSLGNAARLIALCDEAFVYRNDKIAGYEVVAIYSRGMPVFKAIKDDWLP